MDSFYLKFQSDTLNMACSFLPQIVKTGSDEEFEDQMQMIRNIRKEFKDAL